MKNYTNSTIERGVLSEDIFTQKDIEEVLSEVFITDFEFDKLFEDLQFPKFEFEEINFEYLFEDNILEL